MRQRSNSVHITGGAFVPFVVTCSLPPSLNPADARIVFEYNANDPGTITQMTLAASSWYATNAWQQNTLPGRIRVWTKDASQHRNPTSVTNGGDFVTANASLPFTSILPSGATQTFLYVEGIGTSSGWGTDKLKVRLLPSAGAANLAEDRVSYTVVRCVYKVCVTRPYICCLLPGHTTDANYNSSTVNGRSDLTDFFPVWLNIHHAITLFPPSAIVQYKLKQADSAVKMVYTSLSKNNAGDFLTVDGATYGPMLTQSNQCATVTAVTSDGIVISTNFLNLITSDATKGVLLIEGNAATTSPLVLEIWKDGAKILRWP
jgi:hypothetical protein